MKNLILIVTCLALLTPALSRAQTTNKPSELTNVIAWLEGDFLVGNTNIAGSITGKTARLFLSNLWNSAKNHASFTSAVDQVTRPLSNRFESFRTNVSQSINLQKLPYTKRQLESNGAPWTVALLGDSVGYSKMEEMYPWLYQNLGSNGFVSGAFSTFGVHTVGATNILTYGTSNGTNWFKPYYHIGTNDSIVWTNIHGPSILANRFEVGFLRGPLAGGFKIQTSTNGAAYVDALTVDAYAASAWRGELTNISMLPGLWNFRVVGISNAHTSILFGGAFVTNSTGIRIIDFAWPSISFEDYLQVNTNVTYPLLQQLRVNTVTVEEKSTVTNRMTNQALFDRWITNTMPNADRIYVGTTPDYPNANHREQNAWERAYCLTNGVPWFDGESPVGTYHKMTNDFGADDGVHPTAAAQRFIAQVFMDQTGWRRQTPGTNGGLPWLHRNQRWTGANYFNAQVESLSFLASGATAALEFGDRTSYPANPNAASFWYRDGGLVILYDRVRGTDLRLLGGNNGDLSPGNAGMHLGQNISWSNIYGANLYLTRNMSFQSALLAPISSLTNYTADFLFSDRHFFITNNFHVLQVDNWSASDTNVLYHTIRLKNTNATTYTVSLASTFPRSGTNFVRVAQGQRALVQLSSDGPSITNSFGSITLFDSP